MPKIFTIRRGLDIPLKGSPHKQKMELSTGSLFAVCPPDFRILNPRLLIKEGDCVEIGTPVVQNKLDERILLTSPVSGTIKQIVRGDKRFLEAILIESDGKLDSREFGIHDIKSMNSTEIINLLLNAGLWPLIRQRPYGVIANPDDKPKAVFISGFDSSPLSSVIEYQLEGKEKEFQAGIDVLTKLCEGRINLGLHQKSNDKTFFYQFSGIDIHMFDGPHPSGNISVQVNRVDPLNKGELVWTVSPWGITAIGSLFLTGKVSFAKRISVGGSELKDTGYADVISGCQIGEMLSQNYTCENVRLISGSVLNGTNIGKDGFLRFYDEKVSVIKEGDYYEFMGWAKPGFGKFSMSKAYFSWLSPGKQYELDANYHGSNRAFVVTGEYEKVFPFDIYPVQLLKAILAKDIDLMEKLGIYEIVEEDFALCEFVCTSKIESQQIVRDGIDLMLKEMN